MSKRLLAFDFDVFNEFDAGTLQLDGAEVEVTLTVTFEGASATTTRTVVLSFAGTI